MWVFVLSGSFYLLNLFVWVLVGGVYRLAPWWGDMLLLPATMMHAGATVIMGAVWQLTRRRRLSFATLRSLDVTAALSACTCYGWMGFSIASLQVAGGQPPELGLFSGLLAAVNTLTSRAIIVPSTARLTALVSAGGLLPVAAATLFALRDVAGPERAISIIAWCALAVTTAVVGSHVIFGLRKEAAQVRKLGQYTLIEKVGSGGMGSVYRASHAMLRRPTAVKLLRPDHAGEANLARFEREVQLTAALTHPNTVAIYDYGRTPDGLFYYAMEFLDGINLEHLVRQYGPQEPSRVLRILSQVCGALVEAHEIGLIHRDIKPANIILTERGGEPDVAKLLDFGLVKRLRTDTLQAEAATLTLDAANVVVGTPAYMSPEAITNPEEVDGRADLYGLGAVGYFLSTGQPVFENSSTVEVLADHLHTPPVPPSARVEFDLPPDLERLILACLRKRPDDRPRDSRTLLSELRRCRVPRAWSADEANDWWKRFRDSERVRPAQPPTLDGATVTVDVEARLVV
jgi:hypothetical protein